MYLGQDQPLRQAWGPSEEAQGRLRLGYALLLVAPI